MATSTKKYLFLGGEMDGLRRDLAGQGNVISMPVYNHSVLVQPNPNTPAATYGVVVHHYTLQKCSIGGKTYEVMAHSSVKDIMAKLIKGYHGHRNKRYRYPRNMGRTISKP